MNTIALSGCPNCGKSAIFNALTGGAQKIGNYPGVTIERKSGQLLSHPDIEVIDLPGIYGLTPSTIDEQIAVKVLSSEEKPAIVAVVIDASQLERTLGLVLDIKAAGHKVVAVCNMMDLAKKAGLQIEVSKLERELQVPVVSTVGVDRKSVSQLGLKLKELTVKYPYATSKDEESCQELSIAATLKRQASVQSIIKRSVSGRRMAHKFTDTADALALHPILGPVILFGLLLLMFQAVFAWASTPMDLIESGIGWLGEMVAAFMPEDHWITSMVVDGIIAGVGSVVVFLPQILILFFFILLLEGTGYMMRAAFIMDRLMASIGLQGRSFVPLLSSFACAIPGIMAARTVKNQRHRFLTILVAPLMTCSARLPVYVLLIGAFFSSEASVFGFNLQGLIMFGLFLLGIVSAIVVSFVLSKVALNGPRFPFVQDMPIYKWPSFRNLGRNLWMRAKTFLKKAGTLIMAASVLIWVLSTYPKAPEDRPENIAEIQYSYAGQIGSAIEPIFKPMGFDWRIATGLIPGFAAREVMVGAMATVFSVEDAEDDEGSGFSVLQERMAGTYSLATGLALLMWYVFSPQCLATFAVMRRETNSWNWTILGFGYLLALAYVAAALTYYLVNLFSSL